MIGYAPIDTDISADIDAEMQVQTEGIATNIQQHQLTPATSHDAYRSSSVPPRTTQFYALHNRPDAR